MIDFERSGYDNLFLLAGHDWQAKMVKAGLDNWRQVSVDLQEAFDILDKNDKREVILWMNALYKSCGMPTLEVPPVVNEKKEEPVVALEVKEDKKTNKKTSNGKKPE